MNDTRTFHQIMDDITSKLTGDPKKDIPYLNQQSELYKDHEYAKEILRACGRLIYEVMPEDKKEEVKQILKNHTFSIDSTLDEVQFNISKKDYDKALKIMEDLVNEIEQDKPYTDDEASEYHVFYEYFEEFLYLFLKEPKKDVRPATIDFPKIYFIYGSLLVELKRYERAKIALRKGLKWNPVNFDLFSEYCEIFKMTGDMNQFFKLTLEAFKIAFKPKDLARCYRNMGYYFTEKKLYKEAIGCYLMSLKYDNSSKNAQSELFYISSLSDVNKPTMEELEEIASTYGFPIGPDKDVLGLSYTYGIHFKEQGEKKGAKYCLSIFYDLTEAPEVKELIDSLDD